MGLTFYEKDFANNYEELITYYPAFYQQVYEMQEILKAQGKLADGIENGIERAYLNNFIDYADAETIGNLETFLKLDHNRTKELEMRRRIIKAHFVGNGKMSATLIKSMLQAYTEAEVDVELKAYNADSEEGKYLYFDEQAQALYITFFRDGTTKVYISDILELLKRKLPAHLMFVLVDYTEAVIDCKELEKIILSHISMSMRASFWNTEYLDGTWLLDGSVLLGCIIPLKLGIEYGVKMICEERVDSDTEIFMYGTVSNEVKVPISIIGTAIREDEDADVATVTTFAVNVEETIDTFLIQRKNLWYLDGEYVLNGTKLLNAKKIEEAI